MRIEFIPKTRAKILSVEAMSEKKGQTDMVPAVAVTLLLSLPTDKMAILDGSLKDFYFRQGEKAQGELEPTLVLTDAAKAMAAVQVHKPASGEASGKVPCPACRGGLSFNIQANGLSRGRCGCGLAWLQ